MNKKKAIKIATAATIAASAFVAAAPAQTSAAFNADTAVKNARTQMYNLYQSYSQPGATFVSWNKFNSDLKKAVANYNSVKSQVSKSNAKNKKQLLQGLDFSYNVYVKDYAQTYINARTAAGKLMDAITKLEASTKAGDLNATNLNYASVTKEAAATNTLAKKIHGAAISKRFTDYYAKLAQDAKDVVIYELTIYTNYKNAEKALADNDTAKAQAFLDKVQPHFLKINASSELGKNLLKYVDEVKAKFAPKVTSVSAINAKTITVEFSKAIDAKTLKDASDKDVITVVAGEGAQDAGTLSQSLSADGKTLTIKSAANSYFKGDYTVKVPFEIVKDVVGKFVSPVNQKVTVADKTAPSVTSAKATVKATTEKIASITLTFDEEVSNIDNVKINGVNYVPVIDGNTATVAVDLDATKSYDVTVVNAQDAAGNISEVQTKALSVSVDNIAPSITKVEATGENTLKVTLDKELKDDTLVVTGKVGTFTANVVDTAVVNPENKKEYTVTLKDAYLFKNGNSDTVTLTVAKEALVDKLGNKNAAEITKTAVVSKDAVNPGVTKVENTSTNGKVTGFVVTYNEAVKAVDPSKVSVVNSKGEILAYNDVIADAIVSDTDNKKVVFTLKDVAADKYGFDFAEGFVTDTALTANKAPKYAFTVDVTSATAPVVTSFTIADASATSNLVTVNFGVKVKATGTGSALNPASYQLDGSVLPSTTEINFVKDAVTGAVDQTQVEIKLPAGFVKASDDKAVFRVTGVQTLDNKVNNSFIKSVEVTDNTAPEAKSFVATDLTDLTVTYSEALDTIGVDGQVTDEIKLLDSKGASVAITGAAVNAEGKLVLTVADASTVAKITTVAATTVDTTDLKDASGNAQKAGLTINK